MQDGCNFEDYINSTCAPSSPTKVINHSDLAASATPCHPPVLRHAQGHIRSAEPLSGADVVLPQSKRRRTSSSYSTPALHVPAAVGNSAGKPVESARQQALSNPIDHIFQFHKASSLVATKHVQLAVEELTHRQQGKLSGGYETYSARSIQLTLGQQAVMSESGTP